MEREIWSGDKIRGLFDLTGKVAIVTGGSGAFGHDAAKGLAAYGANVVITSRRAEHLNEAAAEIKQSTGADVLPVSRDAVDADSVEAMVQKTIDLLDAAHAAGPRQPGALQDLHAAHPLGSRRRSPGLHRGGRVLCLRGLGLRHRRHPGGRRRQHGRLIAVDDARRERG